jgi:hypothetical protein
MTAVAEEGRHDERRQPGGQGRQSRGRERGEEPRAAPASAAATCATVSESRAIDDDECAASAPRAAARGADSRRAQG